MNANSFEVHGKDWDKITAEKQAEIDKEKEESKENIQNENVLTQLLQTVDELIKYLMKYAEFNSMEKKEHRNKLIALLKKYEKQKKEIENEK